MMAAVPVRSAPKDQECGGWRVAAAAAIDGWA